VSCTLFSFFAMFDPSFSLPGRPPRPGSGGGTRTRDNTIMSRVL
jgi:hypothetical protein